MLRLSIALALAACSSVLHAASDGETPFKTKAYVPHKSVTDASYKASAYAPSRAPRPLGKPFEKTGTASRWNIFRSGKTADEPKTAHDPVMADGPVYTQQKHISVPTIKADANDIPEKKPFEESGKKLADLKYKPADTAPAKNPLLKPRQSIEAPQ